METIKYIIVSFVIASVMTACDPEENITSTEKAQNELVESLQGTWTATEVRKENTVISDFDNLSLTINEKSYTCENGSPVWPSSGTFDFSSAETENEFIRKDGRLFTASESSGKVTITIVYNEETSRGEFGTYEFTLE